MGSNGSEQLRISQIEIQDTFGIEHIKFSPGTVTRIKARNGDGKSSILRGIAKVFEGGCDPSIIRRWRCGGLAHLQSGEWMENASCHTCLGRGYFQAPKSVVTIRLSDGVTITNTVAVKKPRKGADPTGPVKYDQDLSIVDVNDVPVRPPKEFVEQLSRHLAIDPSILLRIDATTTPGKRELARILLELMPISFAPEEVKTALSFRSSVDVPPGQPDVVALQSLPSAATDLDGLKKISLAVAEMRRRIGQTREDSDGAITRLRKALPEGTPEDRSAKLTELEQEQVETESAVADERVAIERRYAEETRAALLAQKDADAAAESDFQAELRRITKIRDDVKAAALAALNAEKERITCDQGKELENLEAQARPERERLAGEIASVKTLISAYEKAITLRQELAIQEKVCREAHWKYDRLSDVLTNIEKLRLDRLKGLPVDGLVVEDGNPTLDGVDWANVNLARRIEAALQICTQLSGKLSFSMIDDSEHLSTETRNGIEEGLVAAGFQVIECQVTDGPLTIETL